VSATGAGTIDHAVALQELGRHEDAVAMLRRVLADEPGNPFAHYLQAVSLLELGRSWEAEPAARRAVDCAPDWSPPYVLLSSCLRSRRALRRARRAAETATRLDPDDPHAWYERCLAEATLRHRRAAGHAAGEVARLAPGEALAAHALAVAAMTRRQWDQAEAHARQALAMDAGDPMALNNLGVILQHQRRREEAGQLFVAAARQDPLDPVPRANLWRATNRWALICFLVVAWPLRAAVEQVAGRRFGPSYHLAFLLAGAVVAAVALLIAFARAPEDGRAYLGLQLRRKTRRLLAWAGGLAGACGLLALLTTGTTLLDGPAGDHAPVVGWLFVAAGGLLVVTVIGTVIGLLLTVLRWGDPPDGG
jgi:Flp pilus assembly protein TadD